MEADPEADLGAGLATRAQCVRESPHGLMSWPGGMVKSIADEIDQGSVTGQRQGARIGTNQNLPSASRSTVHMAIKFGRPIEMRDAPPRQTALASTPLDLAIRPRRNRKAEWARRLVRENVLPTDDLIWRMFVVGGHNMRTPGPSMPGVDRLTVDQAVRDAE